MTQSKRFAYYLPNVFTALNMACGFIAIIYAWKGKFYEGCMILILGAIFDSVDGRVARLTGTQSSFGEQFDSISDVVSFGMAPAFLVYRKFLFGFDKLGIVISFIFLLCGALRLARFNANIEKVSSNYFQGLPIPAAAMAMIGITLIAHEFPIITEYSEAIILYTFFYSVLMITNIPFNSFKNSEWVRRRKKTVLVIIFSLLALTFTYEEVMVGAIISIYTVSSIIYFIFNKGKLEDVFEWDSDEA